MGLRSSPLAYTILPSSAGGLGLFQSNAGCSISILSRNILFDNGDYLISCSFYESYGEKSALIWYNE